MRFVSEKTMYSRTLRLNLNNPQHKKVHDILLVVDGSANAYIINSILCHENFSRASPEDKIAQKVVQQLLENGFDKLEVSSSSPMPEKEIEPNFDFCS